MTASELAGDEQNEQQQTRSPAPPSDDLTETQHTLATPAGEIRYTASAGRVVLREQVHEDGRFKGVEAKAEMFITAYTLDGADPATRPVIFAFNGGPGSSVPTCRTRY